MSNNFFHIDNPKDRLERLDMLASTNDYLLFILSFLMISRNFKNWNYFRGIVCFSMLYVLLSSVIGDVKIIYLTGLIGFIIWFWFDFFTGKYALNFCKFH